VADGFVLVDKSGGWTSHDVVARCRRLFAMRRIGHAGTLDPMATGLLVVALGRATRLLRFVQDAAKTYEAVAMFGVATDSLDADGAILSREEMAVDEEELRAVARRFIGTIAQVPPMVSAIKVEGRRLYQLARAGLEVERTARPVEIHALDIEEVSPGMYPEVTFRVTCGSGTYVRVLADDMARALGGRAHLVSLRRTSSGPHRVEEAWTIPDLESAAAEARLDEAVLSPARGLSHLAAVTVDEATAAAVRTGAPFAAGPLAAASGWCRVLDAAGGLLAVYRGDGRRAAAEVVMG
jgi:tRNA pseudouridine55 synthase